MINFSKRARSSLASASMASSRASCSIGLIERGLKRLRIDLGEEVALLDLLALDEADLDDAAGDLGSDRDGG